MKKEIICMNDEELQIVAGGNESQSTDDTIKTVGAVLGVCGIVFLVGAGCCSLALKIKSSKKNRRNNNRG